MTIENVGLIKEYESDERRELDFVQRPTGSREEGRPINVVELGEQDDLLRSLRS